MINFGHLDESTHFLDQQKEQTGPVTMTRRWRPISGRSAAPAC